MPHNLFGLDLIVECEDCESDVSSMWLGTINRGRLHSFYVIEENIKIGKFCSKNNNIKLPIRRVRYIGGFRDVGSLVFGGILNL